MGPIEAIQRNLGGGFHDGHLLELNIDYATARASLIMEVWDGRPLLGEVEKLRRARLVLGGLRWLSIAPPTELSKNRKVSLDGDVATDDIPAEIRMLRDQLPSGSEVYKFFVYEWSACIFVSCQTARFEWL